MLPAPTPTSLPDLPFTLNTAALRGCLPQRGALFACQALQILGPLHFIGTARWESNHPGLEGHFPEAPTVPGVLLIECATQLAGAGLICTQADLQQCQTTHRGVLASVRQCRFRRPVLPDTEVQMHLNCRRRGPLQVQIQAQLLIGSQRAADLEMLLIYTPRRTPPAAVIT